MTEPMPSMQPAPQLLAAPMSPLPSLSAATGSQAAKPELGAMAWLLAHTSHGKRHKGDIDRQLAAERNW